MGKSVVFNTSTYNPRRNLPSEIASKRTEANFVGAFQRRYMEEKDIHGIGVHHFAISGYGIADFVWLDNPHTHSKSCYPLSQKSIREHLLGTTMTAFEMKLTDWKKAIQQAYRYSYFADTSIVVLPSGRRAAVLPQIELFKQMDIGLWFFDKKNDTITKTLTPSRNSPRNTVAKEKAVDLLVRKVYLRSLRKSTNSVP